LNRIRGFAPWPGCYGFLRGGRLHVWKARPADLELAPGALRVGHRRLYAGCGGGSIEFLEVQLEGKKRMDAASFLNGFSIAAEEVLA
jgi:methionyl-tRNA formyltransferase